MTHLAAEPASIIYIVTGVAGIFFARLRMATKREESSVAMLFCRRATRERLRDVRLM